MKIFLKTSLIAAGFLLCLAFPSFGQQFWKYLQVKTLPTKGKRVLIPEKYKVISLNQGEMRTFLNELNSTPENGSTIELPDPTGKQMTFKIWKTPVLPPVLQKKYPMIQTFTAVSLDNPYVSAKIDYTVFGFHAMVYEPGKVWMIDPYSNTADGYYISFYQKDAPPELGVRYASQFPDLNKHSLSPSGSPVNVHSENNPQNKIENRLSSNVKHTYHLALSCTGEYAEAVADTDLTKAAVLSAMTTTMNRVNGIYEREIDVTMIFINNEDTLIYLNPNTDPFTANNNGGILLGQNQNNTDLVIGSNNYDMGHIFSTGGGGIAELASVCNPQFKAEGVTGLANPIGDAFAVDYVAHEMGHQFSAEHTFNDCNGNENWSTAYEPGSGSTIMAYAGICGSDNDLQEHSDAYFHAISLLEITDFLASSTCGTDENISVGIPSFSSIQQSYKIPAGTPFELTAPTATAGSSQDSLSYCWEQWDLGDLGSPEIDAATQTIGPIFRSVYPKINNPVRVFPDLEDLVHNHLEQTPGERLSEVSRTLHFKLTVRNIQDGWGSFQISDDSTTVQVVNTGQPFKVTAPDTTGLVFHADSSINVSWNISGTNNAPINCQTVDIYLSTDSGYNYTYTLATNLPNTGQATIQLPNINTIAGRIKVKAHDNVFFDISDYNFTIEGGTGISDVNLKNSFKIAPNPATNQVSITTSYVGKVHVALYNLLGQRVWQGDFRNKETIATGLFSRGIYFLKINLPASNNTFSQKIILQ